MTAGVRSSARPRDYDWALSLLSLAGAALCASLLLSDRHRSGTDEDSSRPIATLSASASTIRRRPARTLVWEDLAAGAPVHDRDTLFVPPGSEARVTYLDGSTLEVDENSLVVLESPRSTGRSQATVDLRKGSLSGATVQDRLDIRSRGGLTSLNSHTEARVDLQEKSARVDVYSGEVRLSGSGAARSLGAREAGALNADGRLEPVAAPTVTLELPPRNERLYFQGNPDPVELTWKPLPAGVEPTLQVARDRGFGFVVLAERVKKDSWSFTQVGPGVFWWRLVDDQGVSLSEARRFTVIEDLPPTLLTPPNRDRAWQAPGQPLRLGWTAVKGVTSYRVELARTSGFNPLERSERVSGDTLSIEQPLPEAVYYWRVRADEKERGTSPFGRPSSFQLLHKALPRAPQLFQPEIEVEPAKPSR